MPTKPTLNKLFHFGLLQTEDFTKFQDFATLNEQDISMYEDHTNPKCDLFWPIGGPKRPKKIVNETAQHIFNPPPTPRMRLV